MIRNPGRLPPIAAGKRVRVKLRNGSECASWPADGKSGCRWSLTGEDHDIVAFEVCA